MADKYLVILNVASDDKVQKALRSISTKPDKVTLDDFIREFDAVLETVSLAFIIDKAEGKTTPEGRKDFLFSQQGKSAVMYPINDDYTINFKEPVYGNDVDPMYLQDNS